MRATTYGAILAFGVLVSLDASSQVTFGEPEPVTCNRDCLTALVDSYLAALVEHDPFSLPLSPSVRFVENAVPTRVGEGLWRTASALPTTFKIYVPDEVSGQVGFMGVMEEAGAPVQLALRLRVENGLITEIEHLIARNLRENGLANLASPRPDLLAIVPPAERVSRAAMLDIGYSYYVALQGSDGSAAPFADDCERHENGMQTTGNPPPSAEPTPAGEPPGDEPAEFAIFGALGCKAQLDTHIMSYIKRIDNRRVEIADVETGLVFGLSHFRHPMEQRTLKIVGMPGIQTWDMDFDPFDLPAAHIFKIRGGEIHEIEAMGFMLPYNSPTGW